MKSWCLRLVAAVSGVLMTVATQAATQAVSLSKLETPTCEPATFNDKTGKCEPATNMGPFTKETCPKVSGFGVVDGKCVFNVAEAKPRCDPTLTLSYDAESRKCVLLKGTPTSSPGAYVGDCFEIKSVPAGSSLQTGSTYVATWQRREGEDDRMLSLVDATLSLWPVPGIFGCRATTGGTKHEIAASNLVTHGALRHGWAFGALAMPYKYYRSTKEFQVGVPIGAYLGYRLGQAGSGYTLAGAFTVSQVKANTIDPDTLNAQGEPTVTGSTDVAALSGALGVVFDLSKEPGTKPFKAGLFVGRDRINRAPNIDYKNNGKTWIALQIGFDFTDN